VVALVIAVVTLAFILQNRERVSINLFTITVSTPVWLVLTVMVLIGMGLGALLRGRR
jgi:uncharacterized integral membrane protein